ncbi:MAG: prolipoprotein diacylglyceryl transferase, partial [Sulfobacillus sp.]|nr:prolipoprotein diacylglyceryl transferase [Sulfobacillus sp.]
MLITRLSPYAFHIGPIGVHWYGIFMVLAILGGGWYLMERGEQLGEDPDFLSRVTIWTVIWGIIGA